eukprot:TRINITY_DN6606_c0_g1_i1.p1 TRINITY_DN6606_c0_g1~~TRINITY_DN6606_c0_g1_i1.p1  ORF type:complete len:500 (+),score=146.65 TRINITY_DN6606_c0_g1_i1:903-2402(+)
MRRRVFVRCAGRMCSSEAQPLARPPDPPMGRCRERIGQPTAHTHPHLLRPGEVTVGVPGGEYARRRRQLLTSLRAGTVLVVPGYPLKHMANDIPWPFRQESNFLYLTGCQEPGACAVFVAGDEPRWELFVKEKNAAKELWDGIMTGHEAAKEQFGPDHAHRLTDLPGRLTQILAESTRPQAYLHAGVNGSVDEDVRRVFKARSVAEASPTRHFRAMRSTKAAPQLALQRRAAAIAKDVFRAAMRITQPGLTEHHVWAVMDFAARMRGAQWLAYPPVIAGGRNGLTLHYIENMDVLREGDLLLVDAGAEYHCHVSDVTRTWPVSGRFTAAQRQVYEAVLRIHGALVARMRAGVRIREMQQLSEQLARAELQSLGVLIPPSQGSAAEARAQVVQYYPHAFGHPLGMDVHEELPDNEIVDGCMFTIEPGLYLPNKPEVPEHLRGIAVRIEDNLLVQEGGAEVLTDGIARTPDEIESWALGTDGLDTPLDAAFFDYVRTTAQV